MKNQKDEGIFKPRPIRGFDQKTVLYIPVDLPSFKIQKVLKKRAKKIKNTPSGQLYGFEDKAVLSQCVGAPLAVLKLERLIISGAQEIIMLGFCGTLDEDTNIGEVVSVTEAASEEGTSTHYFPRKRLFRASSRLKARVEDSLTELGLSFVNGSVVSMDAPYRETPTWLARNRAKGIGFVDMETSAVFALADFYGIQAAALHLVSDKLTSSSHQMGLTSLKLARNIQKYFMPFIDPGMQACEELGVRSPLKEVGLGKEEIRVLSKHIGLSTWNKPSLACLASRFPYNSEIDKISLEQVAKAEEYLWSLDFSQVRVRHHDQIARVEVDSEGIQRLLDPSLRVKIVENLKKLGYSYVTLDLAGYRTGSMNEPLSEEVKSKK